jgi:hypothetical protein
MSSLSTRITTTRIDHRSRDQRRPDVEEQPTVLHQFEPRSLLRTLVLGGIANEYRYAT